MAHGRIGRSVDVRGAVLIALLCVATLLWAGCSTTSGPSEPSDGTPPGMLLVPAGVFTMGDPASYCADEHEVTLTRDFYLAQYEVTNQQYMEAVQWALDHDYVTATSSSVNDNLDGSTVELLDLDSDDCEISYSRGVFACVNPEHPVIEVTWYGAARYCDWLSLMSDPPLDRAYEHGGDWLCNDHDPYGADGYRLPTDAEWEYAAQYNDDRVYPWGDAPPDFDLANYWDWGCEDWTLPVGSCLAGNSALGFSDLAGNVWEWCNDWSVCDLGTAAASDPVGPATGTIRAVRGGSWYDSDDDVRSANREASNPINSSKDRGFRAARTVSP